MNIEGILWAALTLAVGIIGWLAVHLIVRHEKKLDKHDEALIAMTEKMNAGFNALKDTMQAEHMEVVNNLNKLRVDMARGLKAGTIGIPSTD